VNFSRNARRLRRDQTQEEKQFLAKHDIEELRFWNHQWRKNPEGVLLEIWHAVQRRTGCVRWNGS